MLKDDIKEALERYKNDPIFKLAVDSVARKLVKDFADVELQRMKRDYEIFEELAPPDVPRTEFVKQCYDAWDREQEKLSNSIETTCDNCANNGTRECDDCYDTGNGGSNWKGN